ncbi:hypothetical protein FOA52_001547 [Chlamydomonas sp. UWO 241]|nr:hypothetical protein FOA52_001547 [Chlamydomonas sp. UWO 241]
MMAQQDDDGMTALMLAALMIAASKTRAGTKCYCLLLLLRRGAIAWPQPIEAHQARALEYVTEMLRPLLDNDHPDVRDECVRLLLEQHGAATGFSLSSPVVSRIFRELSQLARVPQLINEAVVEMALEREQRQQRRV